MQSDPYKGVKVIPQANRHTTYYDTKFPLIRILEDSNQLLMKILCIAGARPNFMKIAPLMRAIGEHPAIEGSVIHTGQHYDASMSKIFFDDLGIPAPSMNLEVGSGTRREQIVRIMERFDPVVLREKPDAVLVVGDVNSTIACARVAKHHDCSVIHVEAGLRSFDTGMSEEINRVETDQISDLLFVTEQSGMDNLKKEAVPGKAFLVGNVMIDTLVQQLKRARSVGMHQNLGLTSESYFLGTFHRPSNVDAKIALENVVSIIEYVAESYPIILPLHPRTQSSLEKHCLLERLQENSNVKLIEPLGYIEFLSLMCSAKGVVTDSGGLQEETTYLQVPCVTMRDNTERPVTVEVGSNILAGIDPEAVMTAIDRILDSAHVQGEIPPLWDGNTAGRIIAIISKTGTLK